jgi:stearoyl-CoA desaturase (delta-9 desaturase)
VIRNEQRLGSRVIRRAAEQLAGRFSLEHFAAAVRSSDHRVDLLALREALDRLQHSADMLWNLHLPKMPTRDQLLAEARSMFAETRSLNEIVDRAYALLIASARSYLAVPVQ